MSVSLSHNLTQTRCRAAIGMLVRVGILTLVGSNLVAQDAPTRAAPIVELIEAGSQPQKPLRLTLKKGTVETNVMRLKMEQKMTMGGNPLPAQSMPATIMTIRSEITDVSPNGDISFKYGYAKADVVDDPKNPSPVAAQIREAYKSLEQLTGSGIMTSQGFTLKNEVNIPADLAPPVKATLEGMKEAISNLCSPFPKEPIGVGGKWRVTQQMETGGMKIQQTSEYQLISFDDRGAELSVNLLQKAEPQPFSPPAAPPGATFFLDGLASKGTGKMKVRFSSLVPDSKTEISSDSKIKVTVFGQEQVMSVESKIVSQIDPEK